MVKCPNPECGADNLDGTIKCSRCGRLIGLGSNLGSFIKPIDTGNLIIDPGMKDSIEKEQEEREKDKKAVKDGEPGRI